MYLMYVDESGDPGKHPLSSPHFILSGLIVAQHEWDNYLARLKLFRKSLKEKYKLNQRTEIHTAELIRVQNNKDYKTISKSTRLQIIKDYCSEIPIIFDTAQVINVCIHIQDHPNADIFELAWSRLLQCYDLFLKTGQDKGIVIADDTDSVKLMNLQRKMRVYQPTSSHFFGPPHNTPIDNIIEDTFSRSSHHSYFLQSVDIIAHLLYRMEYPKGSLKKFGLEHQFKKLASILLKQANLNDSLGIVRK